MKMKVNPSYSWVCGLAPLLVLIVGTAGNCQPANEAAHVDFRQRLKSASAHDFFPGSRPGGRPFQCLWLWMMLQDSSGRRVVYLRYVPRETATGRLICAPVDIRELSGDPRTEGSRVEPGRWYKGEADFSHDRATNTVEFASKAIATRSSTFNIQMRNGSYTLNESDDKGSIDLAFSAFGNIWEFEWGERTLYRSMLGTVAGTLMESRITGFGGVDVYFGDVPFVESSFFMEQSYEWIVYARIEPDSRTTYGVALSGLEGVAGGMIGDKPGGARLIPTVQRASVSRSSDGTPTMIAVEPFGSFQVRSLIRELGPSVIWREVGQSSSKSNCFGWWEQILHD